MKTTLLALTTCFTVAFIPNLSQAQPGDFYGEHRLRWFIEVQDSVEQYPDDLFYKWARMELIFRPYFDLYTPAYDNLDSYTKRMSIYQSYQKDSIVVSRKQACKMCGPKRVLVENPANELRNFVLDNQENLLSDLNMLIEEKPTYVDRWAPGNRRPLTANLASYLYRRGQLYYVTDKPEDALKDYKKALESNPTGELKKEIYVSIAGIHLQSKDNRLALKYLNLAEPAIEDSTHLSENLPAYYRYESVKLALLDSLGDSTAIVNYLQNRSANYLGHYYTRLGERNPKEKPTHAEGEAIRKAEEYELMIYEYLKRNRAETGPSSFLNHKKAILDKL